VWWLGILLGHITLEGDLSFMITPSGYLAPVGSYLGVVTVGRGGSFIQQGNLLFSFKGSWRCILLGLCPVPHLKVLLSQALTHALQLVSTGIGSKVVHSLLRAPRKLVCTCFNWSHVPAHIHTTIYMAL
jgi:hypothetical protein